MASISITTTQNVTIDYTLAGFSQRLMAYLVDLLVIIGWIFLHLIIKMLVFGNSSLGNIYVYVAIIPFFTLYTLIMENVMNGQTPGKKSLNIRVLKLNGAEPSFMDYFIRWSLRFIDIYLSSGVLACIMISTTKEKQRLADIIAGTVMVKIQANQNLTTEDLLKISSQSNYEPTYPQVVMFTENDMLHIKKLVDRYLSIGNESHRYLVIDTANKLSSKMDIAIKENKPELFLKTLIRDYVVLTR